MCTMLWVEFGGNEMRSGCDAVADGGLSKKRPTV